MSRLAFYRCPTHGRVPIHTIAGFGAGPVPASAGCPRCGQPSLRDGRARTRTSGRRSISVSRATYDRLRAYCDAQGLSIEQVLLALVPDTQVTS